MFNLFFNLLKLIVFTSLTCILASASYARVDSKNEDFSKKKPSSPHHLYSFVLDKNNTPVCMLPVSESVKYIEMNIPLCTDNNQLALARSITPEGIDMALATHLGSAALGCLASTVGVLGGAAAGSAFGAFAGSISLGLAAAQAISMEPTGHGGAALIGATICTVGLATIAAIFITQESNISNYRYSSNFYDDIEYSGNGVR